VARDCGGSTLEAGFFRMAKKRCWFVESKEYEMLIKGGNAGLRIIERNKKKQGTIYIQRDELAWLVGAAEEAMDVDISEVYWDQSRAGVPRLLVQRRANRHGRFITFEEFEGRNRRGSVVIPEGRHGQGWTRLISELRIARMTLWKGREFRESKVVVGGSGRRSFAEVVGQPKAPELSGGPEQTHHQKRPVITKVSELETGGGRGRFHHQTGPAITPVMINTQTETVTARNQEEKPEKRVVDSEFPEKSVLHETLQNPAISGKEATTGGRESEGDGRSSLHTRDNLLDLKRSLTVMRDQVVLGLKRVEEVLISLEQNKCVGCEGMGHKRNGPTSAAEWIKPKKKKARRNNKSQAGLLGSKPNMAPAWVAQSPGPSSCFPYRLLSRHSEKRASQAGESARATGANGVISGELSPGAEVLEPINAATARGTDLAGELDGAVGRGEEALESVGLMGFEIPAPMRGSKESDSPTMMLSTIPESVEGLGCDSLTLEKGSKRESAQTENAGEGGFDDQLPVEQSKPLKVFHRRDCPLPKVTKSWVAERVSWNGGRGCDEATKEDTVWVESEDLAANGFSVLGELEDLDSVGGMGNQEEDLVSPASKDLKLAWNLKGTAGISYDGQEGKLKEVFGQIVAGKYGEGASYSAWGEADGNLGMRDVDSFYEA
jgi:hypothetical protein